MDYYILIPICMSVFLVLFFLPEPSLTTVWQTNIDYQENKRHDWGGDHYWDGYCGEYYKVTLRQNGEVVDYYWFGGCNV